MSQIKTKFIQDSAVTNAKVASGIDAAKLADGSVSNAELQFIGTLTSNAQTQLDGKIDKSTATTKGDLLAATASATIARLGVGTNGQVLTADSTQATGIKWATPSTGESRGKQSITLSGTDITNQYIDLAQPIAASSLDVCCSGLVFNETVDYTVSLTGGAGGVTRVSFIGDLATGGASALVATDVVYVKYEY
jgi:hypothetical protein